MPCPEHQAADATATACHIADHAGTVRAMRPRLLSLSVTATVSPPLDPEQTREAGRCLARLMDGLLVAASQGAAGWVSWRVGVPHEVGAFGHLLAYAEDYAGAAVREVLREAGVAKDEITVRVEALEAVTEEEVARQLAAHGGGIPGPGEGRVSDREMPPIPEVVATTKFAELCGLTPQDIRQLHAERQYADEHRQPHPFPDEFIAGHWLREEAETYAATLRGNT